MWAKTFRKFAIVIIKVYNLISKTRYFFFKPNDVSLKHVVHLILLIKHHKCCKLICFENAGHFVEGVDQTLVTHRLFSKVEKMEFIKFMGYQIVNYKKRF